MKNRAWFLRLIVALLVLLLSGLATLQYIWLGRLSDNELQRMRASLQASSRRFTEDFDAELTRLCKTFAPIDPAGAGAAADVSGSMAQWQKTPYPGMLDQVYLIVANQDAAKLLRWDRAGHSIVPAAWNAELEPVRQLFMRRKSEVVTEPSIQAVGGFPALIIPGVRALRDLAGTSESGWILLTLNRESIQTTLVPALASRYLSGDHELLYDVAILDCESPKSVILASSSKIGSPEAATVDAVADIFRLHLNDLLVQEVSTTRTKQQSDRLQEHTRVILQSVPAGSESPMISTTVDDDNGTKTIHTIKVLSQQPHWQAFFKHRAGSLEEVVGQIRKRNLLLSFSVLLLLGISVILILVETRRVQKLAAQQIRFVAGVSHELRTPLSVICSAGENLRDAVVNDPEQIRRYGDTIAEEGRRLTEMIERILDFAGIQSGRSREQVPVQIQEVVSGVTAKLAIPGKTTIEIDVPNGLPSVLGDRVALESAITNLLDNAQKYAAPPIRIQARADRNGSGGKIVLSVRDHGPGISPQDLPHVSEPFFRGRNATAARVRGSGLGLSIARHVAESHGGTLTVESAEGSGCCVSISLPSL